MVGRTSILFSGNVCSRVGLEAKDLVLVLFVHKDLWAWNWLDLLIVGTGVFDSWLTALIRLFQQEVLGQEHSQHSTKTLAISSLLHLARLLRVLRLARLVHAIPALYKATVLKQQEYAVIKNNRNASSHHAQGPALLHLEAYEELVNISY